MGVGQCVDDVLIASVSAEGDHGRLDGGQDVVVQDAAGALVDDLALGQSFTLQIHQPPGHLGAGLGVDEAFAADAGDLDLFLGVEAAVALGAEEEEANQAALAPEGNGPDRAVVLSGF